MRDSLLILNKKKRRNWTCLPHFRLYTASSQKLFGAVGKLGVKNCKIRRRLRWQSLKQRIKSK